MSDAVTFHQLQTTLSSFGFEATAQGGHVIFRHPETGVVITLPNVERTVRQIYVNTAARQLANAGIAAPPTFLARLLKTAKHPPMANPSSVH